jgi:esterase/lipase superfamily enzyme
MVVQFEKQETKLELFVRGFVVTGEQNESVASLNNDLRWLAKSKIVRDARLRTQTASIVIPYAALKLPVGEHQIAYEITGRVDGRVVFVRPTGLTKVIVGKQARQEIVVSKTEFKTKFIEQSQKVIVAGERVRGESPKTSSHDVPWRTPVLESFSESKTVKVEIPGGFRRSSAFDDATNDQPEDEKTFVSDVESLKGRQWESSSQVLAENERRIWFATNRKVVAADSGRSSHGPDLSNEVSYGVCTVSVPVQNHRKGNLETPSWWTKRNPDKHFIIETKDSFDKKKFIQQLGQKDILLFVHGFNNSFDDAIFRTAQLQHDLNFAGQSIAFSWPSAGEMSAYESDQRHADQSVAALVEVIASLAEAVRRSGQTNRDGEESEPKIHIIAHSLGNRVLLQSLCDINLAFGEYFRESPIGQIVLAAPDVGAIMFNNLSPHAVDLGEQVTYYFCESDAALNISRDLNKYEPVGKMPYFDEGLSTINANGTGTSFISHNYYASSRKVLTDIELMLRYGKRPADRMPPLASATKVFGHQCWAFALENSATKPGSRKQASDGDD